MQRFKSKLSHAPSSVHNQPLGTPWRFRMGRIFLGFIIALAGHQPSYGSDRGATNATPIGTNLTSAASMDTLDDKHKLALGDRISFRIVEDQEPPTALVVTDSGQLEVPYIGRFPAANKTCKLLAREIKVELEKEYYFQATVIIAVDQLSRSRGKVYLVGPVRVPGPQEIPSDEVFTLSKAIMRAGGFGEFADKKQVKVTRKIGSDERRNKVIVVNVADVIEKGKTDKDLALEPGDIIYIPTRLINF